MRTLALYSLLLTLGAGIIIIFTRAGARNDLYATQSPDRSHQQPVPASAPEADSDGDKSNPSSSKTRPSPPSPPQHGDWQFDYERDGLNYGLSEEQCSIAFPSLTKEVDRAVEYRQDVAGKIKLSEVDVSWRGDGIVRAMIHKNQLYLIDPHGVSDPNHRPRALATMNSIHRAITAYPDVLPDIEFSFTTHDAALYHRHENATTWAYSRQAHEESLFLMPDYGMWGWPDVGLRSYAELQAILDHEEDDFLDKIPKILWRGSLDVGSRDVRQGLVDHSKGYDWSDVLVLDWSNKTNMDERMLNMVDHCGYMFLAQTEGNTYSGRFKYLLNCHSIVFSHKLDWIEHFHHLLKDSGPDQNYIKTKRDFGDLPKQMKKLTPPSQWQKAQLIADNARSTFRERYLTAAAEACYWRALIRGWASVQDFTPQFWRDVKEFDKVSRRMKVKRKPRGAPFEAYIIMEETEWEIPAYGRKICIDDD